MTPIAFGFEVHVSPALAGSKHAFLVGKRKLTISPAMHDLMSHASPDELHSLCERIAAIELPDFDLPRTIPVTPPDCEQRAAMAIQFARYW